MLNLTMNLDEALDQPNIESVEPAGPGQVDVTFRVHGIEGTRTDTFDAGHR
jgi:hypothetical protein